MSRVPTPENDHASPAPAPKSRPGPKPRFSAGELREHKRQQQRRRRARHPESASRNRADCRHRYWSKLTRRVTLRSDDQKAREAIDAGLTVCCADEIERPTFIIINPSGKRWHERLDPDRKIPKGEP
jgi:hypothetical protein